MEVSDGISDITIFDSATAAALSAFETLSAGNTAVLVSRDSDYFAFGKAVKDSFEEKGYKVYAIVVNDDQKFEPLKIKPLFEFPPDTGLVVAVGDADVINIARYFSGRSAIKCLAIPTVVDFYRAYATYAEFYEDNLPVFFATNSPYRVVLDKEYFAAVKKQVIADAFCAVEAKLVALFEYVIEGKINKSVLDRVLSAIRMLTNINRYPDKKLGITMSAQLMLARITQKRPLNGTEETLGLLLSQKGAPLSECKRLSIKPLFKLYEAFFSIDLCNNACTPNYVSSIETLSKEADIPEWRLLSLIKPLEHEAIIEKFNRYKSNSSEMLSYLKSFFKLYKEVEKAYLIVYNGKQKRAEFNKKELHHAFKLASVLRRGGVYRLLSDSGVIDCFE